MIYLKDIVKGGLADRFARFRAMGIRTVMITGDNQLTAAAIAKEAGVDDFLAQATPEDKLALIRKEQQGGRLVAMTGDGTNDAPALAQADVGVAMNTGTQAAKEAGNMVDLDSNPTKLIEIVEIGKQLLMTRGALTTFSIANDVAKYFAIIPAMLMVTFPAVAPLNIMHLVSPNSAILSAVIFNALIIVLLIPLALRGVQFRPMPAMALLQRNLLIYGVGGVIAPFIGIKPSTCSSRPFTSSKSNSMNILKEIKTSLIVTLVLLRHLLRHLSARRFSARGSCSSRSRPTAASSWTTTASPSPRRCSAQTFTADKYFNPRPSAAGNGYDSTSSGGSNYGATSQALHDAVKQRVADYRKANNLPDDQLVPADAVTASGSGLDPHISMKNALLQLPRVAKARGMSEDDLKKLVDQIYRRPRLRHSRRARRQHRQTQFGFGRKIQMSAMDDPDGERACRSRPPDARRTSSISSRGRPGQAEGLSRLVRRRGQNLLDAASRATG